MPNDALPPNGSEAPNRLSPELSAKYNRIITFGQSLASGAEGWPALSTEPGYDNLMLGEATRSATYSGDRFVPVGGPVFKPLKGGGAAQDRSQELLIKMEVAQLEKHAQEEGESVEVGALNLATRRLYLEDRGQESDPEHPVRRQQCGHLRTVDRPAVEGGRDPCLPTRAGGGSGRSGCRSRGRPLRAECASSGCRGTTLPRCRAASATRRPGAYCASSART